MIALIQRVTRASVTVEDEVTGEIGPGLLVLLGVEKDDDEQKANRLCERVLGYRIFSDAEGKMNLNVQQAGGSVLVVSQFTLAADTERGMRPSFSKGAAPDRAEALYEYFVERCRQQDMNTQTGRFAADMQVSLVNDGPVTFWLQVFEPAGGLAAGNKREYSYVSPSSTANRRRVRGLLPFPLGNAAQAITSAERI